ncbi:MAG: hypothetical protein GQ559_03125 [Desulfobulbaceae bacterium]|nr:hypothetical protein [Desulfobulbaceae bacterium]
MKINTIVIPGINDHHIIGLAKTMQKLGADLFNCMDMFPNTDNVFEDVPEPHPRPPWLDLLKKAWKRSIPAED